MKLLLLLLLIVNVFGTEYKAVDKVELDKYMGYWYEVYEDNFDKLFQRGTCASATYELLENNQVYVLNQEINNKNNYENITGLAYYKDNDCCGYLTVKLEDLQEAPYWILKLGPIYNNFYDYAVVSDDKALSLFVLARDVERFFELYNEEVANSLNEFGFNKKYNSPLIMEQEDCNY